MKGSVVLEAKKTLCMVQLVNELPVLRACLGLSQKEVADRIGISRQTYNSIESKRRNVTWRNCIALTTLFAGDEKTRKMLKMNSELLNLLDEVLKAK